MKIYRHLDEIPSPAPPASLTIGNFDGVHVGHQQILKRVVEIALERALSPSVLTFDPHPTRVVAPARAPRLLSTPDQRCRWMGEHGVEQVFVLPFDQRFSQITAEAFVEDILVRRLNAKSVLVGENFRFGNRQAGDTKLLNDLGERYGFTVDVIEGVARRGRMVSSSAIRNLIDEGDVSTAGRLMNRPYAIEGTIVSGFGIGSKQTVPTLNLDPRSEILPRDGVYVTRTYDLGSDRHWPSITNIGYRPTFDGSARTVETFLLGPMNGPDPTEIRLEFLVRLRDEHKFESPDALKAQILRDVARANRVHRRVPCETPPLRPSGS